MIEQFTEKLVLSEMKINIGPQSWGYVHPQGSINNIEKIENILKKAGGKPDICEINDFSIHGTGKAKPEFIITFNDYHDLVLVIECKNATNKHETLEHNHPKSFAVDGVLYYAKYLKEEYNVIAIAVSGTSKEKCSISTFEWLKGHETFSAVRKAKDILLEPLNYVKLFKGEKIQKQYSIEDIRTTALEMHEKLREIKMTERNKPIFIAGILMALNNEDFAREYPNYLSFNSVVTNLINSIDTILDDSDIKRDKIENIKSAFRIIKTNEKLKAIPLGQTGSITWYIEELEMKIKPMMDYHELTFDALSVFYHEFIKYTGGDGSGLGIVLTPQHLCEFMCDLAEVNKNSKVVDICCGSGSFLVTAMSKMFKEANAEEFEIIRKNALYGVELDPELYTLAITNMIVRHDGKSNIYHGDCFNKQITKELIAKNINVGLLNPPYSQKDVEELEFVEHLLDILVTNGTAVVVVPMACAIGTKYKDTRKRLFKKHTLKAVFSMPDDIFYPTATNVCVMVWQAHKPHDSNKNTFFGYFKDDGFVKRKKLGRIDAYNKWNSIKNEWLNLYQNLTVKDGYSALKKVTYKDEWLCEAYMKTDYSKVTQKDFQDTLNDYLAYLIRNGENNEN